ncbi:putative CENP-B N-terminal DNA-binding domain-containing protein 15, partial [Homarus americanus]
WASRVLTLNEKNEVLKQLDSGMSYAAVGRHFGLNESSRCKREKSYLPKCLGIHFTSELEQLVELQGWKQAMK